ncbi:MAG: NAD-dependent epimerase/dehydratase family protein [Planctomycetaceae bacterium]
MQEELELQETRRTAVQPTHTNTDLIEMAKRSLGSGRRILITGGTGFVGSALAQVLCDAGNDVTITGRSRFRVRSDGRFVAANISNSEEVDELCRDQEIIFHCAAMTSPWGSLHQHRSVNLDGTENVVRACVKHQVQRLVHVSSTAIYFQFRDSDITDESPLPSRFSCAYAQSKAEAERVVEAAIQNGLNAYIVRARAVFGPGDNALLPRLILAAQQGRLRQIGNNLCDLTYIDNLLAGLILAADVRRTVGCCTITNNSPVRLWPLLHEVLAKTTEGYDPSRQIPRWLAMLFARGMEWKHRLLKLRGEPGITRYSVGLLAHQQTFTSAAAGRDLDYQPIVSVEDGIQRTLTSMKQRPLLSGTHSPQVTVRFYSTGYIEFGRHRADRSGSKERTRFHATIALITHPRFGSILFDAGYSPDFFAATQRWPYRLYRWATKVHTDEHWTPKAWLRREGIAPEDLRLILVSHFHGDHICGLNAFPNAEFITLAKTWEMARHRSGFDAVRRGILPDLIPRDFGNRVHTIHELHDPGLGDGQLRTCHDLFRDGSIRLFNLDGHAHGQMGVLLNTEGAKQVFLVADSFWTRTEIQRRLKPTRDFRMIADHYRAALRTRESICDLAQQVPSIQFVCTHCPDFAREQQFDEVLLSVRERPPLMMQINTMEE